MRSLFGLSSLLPWLLVLLTIVDCLQASYMLRVNLNQYSNTMHSKENGFCCDQSLNPPCLSDCNNQFSFCLQLPSEAEGSCSLGRYQSGFINNDNIVFAQQAVLINPVVFQVNSSWLGAVDMIIQVEDELGSDENDPVIFSDTVSVNISHNPAVSRVSSTMNQLLSMRGVFFELNFELECSKGFYGSDCAVMCTPRDDDLGHYTCNSTGNIVCLDGFTDISTNCTQCILLEGCSPTGGYCNSTDHCVCREEFTGDFCDIDLNVCRTGEVLCENGGTCVFSQNTFSCLCPESYGGPTCETDLNICRTGEAKCENGGTCEYNHTLTNGFVCLCPNNFSGISCEIDLDICGHTSPCINGDCVNTTPGNFTCNCMAGFEGEACAVETDECVDIICRNGGVCKDLHLDYECECTRGFTGEFCEVELDGCIDQKCRNNGTCQNNLGDYICLCVNGFSGINCEIQDGVEESDLSELIGPIIGGSVASAVLLIIIIFLLVALLCLVKQRSRSKQPVSSFNETTNTSSKHIISVDNPSFKDFDTIDSKYSRNRFDNDGSSRHIPGEHYSHLKPRTGDTSKSKPLAPTSTSVVDLINSIGDYSTLVDSTRTVSTTASNNDHEYELIAETRLKIHNAHTANCEDPVTDIDHDYSSLDEGDTVIQIDEEQDEEEIVLTAASGPGLPNPYESSSATTSPDSAHMQSTAEKVNYDHLALKKEIETANVGLTESDCHDYDSADCGLYENTRKKDVEVLYANDLVPVTEALYDSLN